MKKNEVLNQCQSNALEPKTAYEYLYPKCSRRKLKRAHFLRLKIWLKDSRGVSVLLAILFALPIPIGIARLFLRKRLNQVIDSSFPVTYGQLLNEFMVRGISIDVETKDDVKIHIRTI